MQGWITHIACLKEEQKEDHVKTWGEDNQPQAAEPSNLLDSCVGLLRSFYSPDITLYVTAMSRQDFAVEVESKNALMNQDAEYQHIWNKPYSLVEMWSQERT